MAIDFKAWSKPWVQTYWAFSQTQACNYVDTIMDVTDHTRQESLELTLEAIQIDNPTNVLLLEEHGCKTFDTFHVFG